MERPDGLEVVRPFLPPLEPEEIERILSRYPRAGRLQGILRVSGRPYSAAALVGTSEGEFFLKKRLAVFRNREDLSNEHLLAGHLILRGVPTPAVLENSSGDTVTEENGSLYEVLRSARGEDVYRDSHSWMPFPHLPHALEAGKMLGRFHRAVRDFSFPSARPEKLMAARFDLFRHGDLLKEIGELSARRANLDRYLSAHGGLREIGDIYLPHHEKLRSLLAAAETWVVHGDFHANNLFFEGDRISSVIDFHLSDTVFRMYDLAVALDRNGIRRLDPLSGDEDGVAWEVVRAMLAGYDSVFPLEAGDKELLVALLPVHQLDLALTNIDYYLTVERDSRRADWVYEVYLLGHARSFDTDRGKAVLERLGEMLGSV